jgi:hypothetical protein
MTKNVIDLEKAQEILDSGVTRTGTAAELGIHHSTIIRLIKQGKLFDDYFPFDDIEDNRHLYQNFEWLWEEDKLEEITNEAFDYSYSLIDRRSDDGRRIGKYVRDVYEDIFGYLKVKNMEEITEFIFVDCFKCKAERSVMEWYRYKGKSWGLYDVCPDCHSLYSASWNARNQDKIFEHNVIRRQMAEALPGSYDSGTWRQVRGCYNWKCAVSNSKNVAIDHFIPVALGHGGTYFENLIPMDKRLNTQKKHYHPNNLYMKYGVNKEMYLKVISNLAALNNITPSEYESFIDWCFINQRTLSEVRSDQRHSIEIWREATGTQFPLPQYAIGGEIFGEKESD